MDDRRRTGLAPADALTRHEVRSRPCQPDGDTAPSGIASAHSSVSSSAIGTSIHAPAERQAAGSPARVDRIATATGPPGPGRSASRRCRRPGPGPAGRAATSTPAARRMPSSCGGRGLVVDPDEAPQSRIPSRAVVRARIRRRRRRDASRAGRPGRCRGSPHRRRPRSADRTPAAGRRPTVPGEGRHAARLYWPTAASGPPGSGRWSREDTCTSTNSTRVTTTSSPTSCSLARTRWSRTNSSSTRQDHPPTDPGLLRPRYAHRGDRRRARARLRLHLHLGRSADRRRQRLARRRTRTSSPISSRRAEDGPTRAAVDDEASTARA